MIADEDIERAEAYVLIGQLFANPPSGELLEMLGELAGDETDLGQSVAALALAARETSDADADREFADLFYTLNVRNELSPNAAVHLTGSHFGEALLKLREDLRALGIEKTEGVSETEDHVSVLCQVMAGLLTGRLGRDVTPDRIAVFYRKHIASWMPMFAVHVEAAEGKRFYGAVGRFMRLFLAGEAIRYV